VFDGSVRTISWRDVLTAFTDLAHEDRGLTSGAERILVADFLTFVDTNFSQLGPFSTLQRCEAEPYRLHRRLNGVLSQVLASDSNSLPGSHTAVITAYLDYEDRQVKLHMYPADTLQHKRDWSVLSGGVSRCRRNAILDRERDWQIEQSARKHASSGRARYATIADSVLQWLKPPSRSQSFNYGAVMDPGSLPQLAR
jgi:hypothetical protein